MAWNFRHIANATMRSRIEDVCRRSGYGPPVICTPSEHLVGPGHVESPSLEGASTLCRIELDRHNSCHYNKSGLVPDQIEHGTERRLADS